MDDMCGDWYDESESYYDDNRGDDGWGVDSSEFTTELDKSKYTPEQIARAEALARQIQGEVKHLGNQRFDSSRNQQFQQNVSSTHANQINQISSTEDALALLRQKHEQQQQQRQQHQQQPQQQQQQYQPPPQQTPGFTPPAQQRVNEETAMGYLRNLLNFQCGLVHTHGDPTPKQAANLLAKMAAQLTSYLRYPPQDIKQQVVTVFLAVGWDVRTRRPVPGSRPPDGRRICELTYGICCYFAGRLGQPNPPHPSTKLPPRQAAAPPRPAQQRQPQQRQPQQHRQGGFQGGNAKQRRQQQRQQGQQGRHNGSYQGGRGYGGKGGKGGKGYGKGKGGRGGGKGNRRPQSQTSSDGFQRVTR